jgi:hypothetical protein
MARIGPLRAEALSMMDIFYLALLAAFGLLSAALIVLCDRLMGGQK